MVGLLLDAVSSSALGRPKTWRMLIRIDSSPTLAPVLSHALDGFSTCLKPVELMQRPLAAMPLKVRQSCSVCFQASQSI